MQGWRGGVRAEFAVLLGSNILEVVLLGIGSCYSAVVGTEVRIWYLDVELESVSTNNEIDGSSNIFIQSSIPCDARELSSRPLSPHIAYSSYLSSSLVPQAFS